MLSFILVLLCGLYGLWPYIRSTISSPASDIIAGDYVDTGLIVAGLERTRGMADVLSWWYGPWVAGPENAFYRPLTSTIWYLEYGLFGPHNYLAFQIVHFLSHLLAVWVVWLFFRDLLGQRIATVGACLFALSLPHFIFGFPGVAFALARWKDSPDLWFTIGTLISLRYFLRYLRGAESKDLIYALVAYAATVAVKEMAYIVPLLVGLILWHEKKLTTHWKMAAPFYLLSILLVILRFWALGGSGFRFGTNGSWMQRWFINVVGGTHGARLLMGNYLPLAITCTVIALYALYKRAWITASLVSAVAALGFLYTAQQWQNADDPFYYQLIGSSTHWTSAFMLLLIVAAFYRAFIVQRRSQLFAWLWVVVAYIPLMTAPITEHALYFVSLGWSFWFAYTIWDMKTNLRRAMNENAPPNPPNAPTAPATPG